MVKGYQNGLLFNSIYYTPKYGDVVVEYPFDDDEEQATASINRTIYRDGDWNTLCLPFTQSAAQMGESPLVGATIMQLDGTTSNLDGEGLLTLNFETATSIVAGRPYIVKWSPALVINSTDDWNTFASNVSSGTESYSGKTVRLGN